ncbi:hypothetical protein WOLCODRAFT_139875 [Wolfiporia cocos MD-104 SS10]|uniref:Uncharacterized protein n=1 Tax=Wolfiporia cocos (strain MD-104) TaxID=742152 RepID=A0A2H3J082_WOLCO|nr:hypothetical protein WOLCODRAFT_139875 [Wolfiporia cocos MD-104 SS10]
MIPRRPRNNSFSSTRSIEPDADAQPRRSRFDSITSRKRSGSTPPSRHAPSSYVPVEPQEELNLLPHVSVFRNTTQMELHVRSSSVKMTRPPGYEVARSLPVFDVHNKVEGTVLLDTGLCSNPGRLTITMEGSFVYISPPTDHSGMPAKAGPSSMHRHTFLRESKALPVEGAVTPKRSSSSLREAIASVRPRNRTERRPSQTNISGPLRLFPFSFDAPLPNRREEELPPTFCSVTEGLSGVRVRAAVERFEVAYKLIATWESTAGDDQRGVEAPIIFEPECDFESFDGRSMEHEAWVEMPLHPDRPVPFKCAVALPDVPTFGRTASIPYYVVFTTTPRSPSLARDIFTDATITVSLTRQVNMDAPPGSPSSQSVVSAGSPSSASSLSSSEDGPSSSILAHKTRLMRRVVSSAPPILSRRQPKLPIQQLPPLGMAEVEHAPQGFSETRALYRDVYAGFPKRPKLRVEPGQKHPSLSALAQLPDGLYKSKLQLSRSLMPSIDWADLSVKYYLEVSVLFGQDESRARIPIRII